MQELFTAHVNVHDLRNKRCWKIPNVRTVSYGTETIRGPKTWENKNKKVGSQKGAHVGYVKHIFKT